MNNTVAEEHTIARAETQKHRNTETQKKKKKKKKTDKTAVYIFFTFYLVLVLDKIINYSIRKGILNLLSVFPVTIK